MKMPEIKTEKQFWDMADNWYQRSHKLRLVWQDEKETDDRKTKALELWGVMIHRVQMLMPVALKLNTPKPPKWFNFAMNIPEAQKWVNDNYNKYGE